MFTMQVSDKIAIVFLHHSFKKQFYTLFKSNRLELLKWYNWPNSINCENDFQLLITDSLYQYARGESLQCGISYEDQLIGYIGLTKIDTKLSKAELGYWISQEHQGRGVMTQVCKTMIDYAFNSLCLEKLEMSIDTENISCRKVSEALRFELEGVVKRAENINGKVIDHACYGLLRTFD